MNPYTCYKHTTKIMCNEQVVFIMYICTYVYVYVYVYVHTYMTRSHDFEREQCSYVGWDR